MYLFALINPFITGEQKYLNHLDHSEDMVDLEEYLTGF